MKRLRTSAGSSLAYSGLALLGLILWSSPALGDFIVHTFADNNGGARYPVGAAGTFNIPQYTDPGGKPLLKVTLSVVGVSFGGTNTFDNEAGAGGSATVAIGTEIAVRGPIPAGGTVFEQIIVRSEPRNTLTGTVAADNEAGGAGADFVGTDSISVNGIGGSTETKSAFKTSALELSPFEGAGLVAFTFTTLTGNTGSFSTTGGGAFQITNGDIRSEYTAIVSYETLPEPGVLSIVALAGLCALRRRGRGA